MALYNITYKRKKEVEDCFTCPAFDKVLKKCNGLDSVCFQYDEKTRTVINGKTKLPMKV